ncbi:MAG: hypothetical protein Q8922_10185 [Bacteroidota bacterium]|nr:hypothetical protein [Bacteroidota bacterium]MDP4233935.1 hypothetical protein [Bacteroidota bacterium]MDP4242814.1 hypothetical protein [Bacteroidota bacterium]MDP4288292.1 hypothetical protein [Bacteroidota bacterium]
MILTTIALAASLTTTSPATHSHNAAMQRSLSRATVTQSHVTQTEPRVTTGLHSMTDEEKYFFPGRDRFDKTEWYESCFKCARTVIAPEHVDEWKNGGIDAA